MQFVQFAPFAQLFEGVLALCFGVGAGGQSEGPERVPEVFAELDEGVVGAYVGELAFYRGVLGGVSEGFRPLKGRHGLTCNAGVRE